MVTGRLPRRILRWDVNRVIYYLGCYYASNRRYADSRPLVVVIKPGAGRAYIPPLSRSVVVVPW